MSATIRGNFWFPANRKELWAALSNLATLRHCIEGCIRLGPIAADEFAAQFTAANGRADAPIEVAAKIGKQAPPESAELAGTLQGPDTGLLRWRSRVHLSPDHDGTLLTYVIDLEDADGVKAAGLSRAGEILRRATEHSLASISLQVFGVNERLHVVPADAADPCQPAKPKVTEFARRGFHPTRGVSLWLLLAVVTLIGLRLLSYFQG